MLKLVIYENGREYDWFYVDYNNRLDAYEATDSSNHIRIIHNVADALNYANTDAYRSMGNGDVYYNNKEDAYNEFIEDGMSKDEAKTLAERVLVPTEFTMDIVDEEEYFEE